MVLGKLPVLGCPTIWMRVGQGPIVLAVGAGWGCFDIFTLLYRFSPLSPSLWEMAPYRLKYCLKGPLTQNNQPKSGEGYSCTEIFISLLGLLQRICSQGEQILKTLS